MKILYFGDDQEGTTSHHRACALRRLGHEILHVNPRAPIPRNRLSIGLAVYSGFRITAPLIRRHVLRAIAGRMFDVAWLNCSSEIGPRLLRQIRRQCSLVVGYMNDDPFGGRDPWKWVQFNAAISQYNLLAVVRTPNITESLRAGVKRVVRVYMSCDPVAHAPSRETLPHGDAVVFIGSWMAERGPFMIRLLDLGVPLTLYGGGWQKAPEFGRLKSVWRGAGAVGMNYVSTIQSARVALGLLSKGNRDLHTTRSAEIPFIGGAVFCAERTSEHEMLYRSGAEVVVWNTAEECAEQCRTLLQDEERRCRIAAAARQRVLEWQLTNDQVLSAILRVLEGKPSDHPLVQEHFLYKLEEPKPIVVSTARQ